MNSVSVRVEPVMSGAMFAASAFDRHKAQHHDHHGYGRMCASRCVCLLVTALAFLVGLACGVCFALPSSAPAACPTSHSINSTTNKPVVVLHSPVIAHQVITPLPHRPPPPKLVDRAKKYNHRIDRADQNLIDKNAVTFVQPDQVSAINSIEEATSRHQVAVGESAPVSAVDSEAVSGIFWSDRVEKSLPCGYDSSDANKWRDYVKSAPIKRIEPGCGRMQNRLVTFGNGTKSCARYRQNNDQIQGEIFTFYLAQLLGLRNLPPSSVALVRAQDDQWTSVNGQLNEAQWLDERPVVMTRFLDHLQPAYIPAQLRNRHEASLKPSDFAAHQLTNEKDKDELVTLAQWSDLMVLDYLTANLDRMVNNMYNMQWNQAMMDSPAHNLAKDPSTGLLVFLDNESGLLHGYRLLDKYEPFHEDLIGSVCVFRKATIAALEALSEKRDVDQLMKQLYSETNDRRTADALPFLPEKSVKILNERIDRVLRQASKCRAQYGSAKAAH